MRIVLTLAGICLASSYALAQEEAEQYEPDPTTVGEPQQEEVYDPSQHIATDEDLAPNTSIGEAKTDSPLNTEYGSVDTAGSSGGKLARNQGLSKAKADQLEGRKVVTLTGEEIGEIRAVGKSPSHDERVATIDAGDFLGVGQKTIAVPLSKLHRTPSDGENIRLSMMRTALESEPAFDESQLTPEE